MQADADAIPVAFAVTEGGDVSMAFSPQGRRQSRIVAVWAASLPGAIRTARGQEATGTAIVAGRVPATVNALTETPALCSP